VRATHCHRTRSWRAKRLLVAAVIEVLRAKRFHVESDGAATIVTLRHVGAAVIGADEEGAVHVAGYEPHAKKLRGGRWQDPEIEWDPSSEMFVGKDDDTYREPVPGERKRRRSAVAVVVEHLLRVLPERPSAT